MYLPALLRCNATNCEPLREQDAAVEGVSGTVQQRAALELEAGVGARSERAGADRTAERAGAAGDGPAGDARREVMGDCFEDGAGWRHAVIGGRAHRADEGQRLALTARIEPGHLARNLDHLASP